MIDDNEYLSISEAAVFLGIRPADVERLVYNFKIQGVTLVNAASLAEYKASVTA